MNKSFKLLVLLICIASNAQNTLELSFQEKHPKDWDKFIGVDNLDALYFIKEQTLFKQNKKNTLTYSNLQLGKIVNVDVFNSLKILIAHTENNSSSIVDNRLAELTQLNFNEIIPFKTIDFMSTGYDSSIWIFNTNSMQLELFDYNAKKTKFKSIPIQGTVLGLNSDYNSCWLLTDQFLYSFNYLGSMVYKQVNEGYTDFKISKNGIVFLRDNKLFYQLKGQEKAVAITTPNLLIKQFFVTAQTLYIYDGVFLNQFEIKKN